MRGKITKYLKTTVLISVGVFNYLPNAQAETYAECMARNSKDAYDSLGLDLDAICTAIGERDRIAELLGIDLDDKTDSTSGGTTTTAPPAPKGSASANNAVHAGDYTDGPIPVTIEFENEITGLEASDLNVTNGEISSITAVDKKTYKLSVTPIGEADITIEVKANSVENENGTKNEDAFSVKISYSAAKKSEIIAQREAAKKLANTARVTIKRPLSHDGLDAFNAIVEFSKDVVGFAADDITVTNGTLIGFAALSASHYLLEIQPSNKQVIEIKIAEEAAQGSMGYKTRETIGTLGFQKGVEETLQTVNSFLHTRAKSVLRYQPKLSKLISRAAPGANGGYGDLSLNGNEANHQLSFFTSHSRINNSVQAMNAARASSGVVVAQSVDHNTITHSTNRTGSRLGGIRGTIDHTVDDVNTTGVMYKGDGTQDTYGDQPNYANYVDGDPSGTWDLWTQFQSSRSTNDDDESSGGAGFLGLHYYLNDRTILGVMGQVDWIDQDNSITENEVSGRGWMIGPYIAGQFQDHNLFYDARVTYGRSSNKLSIAPGSDDEFDSTRLLVSGSLTGEYAIDEFLIQPGISATYYEETQEAYTDGVSNLIPEQTVSLGEVKFGPTFSRSYDDGEGFILTPSFGFSGIYTYASSDEYISGQSVPSDDGLRLELDGGFNISSANGTQFSLAAFYDGVGDEGYDSYGGSVGFSIPLQ